MLSRPENLVTIVGMIETLGPSSIVDIGPGWGKVGLIAREALTAQAVEAGDYEPDPTKVVELVAWEPSVYFRRRAGRVLEAVYDRVEWRSATVDDHPVGFDLVLMVDVLEHLPKPEGAELVRALVADNIAVLVSTPREVMMYEPPFYGPDFAKHQSQWDLFELDALGTMTLIQRDPGPSHILVLT